MGQVWSYHLRYRDAAIEVPAGEITVGRSKMCDITVDDASVSRKHLILTATAGKLILKDLGSSNGTFINGSRIAGGGVLHNGDTLGLGDARLEAELKQEVEEDQTAFATVRMPIQESPGDATTFLQKASVELAKEALAEDLRPPAEPSPVVFGAPAARDAGGEPASRSPAPGAPTPGASPPAVPPSPAAAPAVEVPRPSLRVAASPPVAAPAAPPPRAPPPVASPPLPAGLPKPSFAPPPEELFSAGGPEDARAKDVGSLLPEPQLGERPSSAGELLPSLDDLDTSMFGRPSKKTADEQKTHKLPPADFWVRAVATFFDALWAGGLFISASLLADNMAAMAASAFAWLVIIAGWSVFGTTPGKRVLGLYVCTLDGRAGIGPWRALLRFLGYILAAIPLGLGFARVLWSADRRGLHDLIAGTYVARHRLS